MSLSKIRNSEDERLDVTFHPGTRHDALVILGHGVTGNKDRPLLVTLADALSKRGWPCLRFSFSGNGDSGGRFEDATITKELGDLQAVLSAVPDYVQIVYIGHSMGAAVGMLTAAEDLRIRALVTLAGMVRTREFLEREFGGVTPGQGCMWDDPACPLSETFAADMRRIDNLLETAARIPQPWLIVHGTADDVVPIQDSLDAKTVSLNGSEQVTIDGAGHLFEGHESALADVVGDWLERTLVTA